MGNNRVGLRFRFPVGIHNSQRKVTFTQIARHHSTCKIEDLQVYDFVAFGSIIFDSLDPYTRVLVRLIGNKVALVNRNMSYARTTNGTVVTSRIGTKVSKACSLLAFCKISRIDFEAVIEDNIHLCSGIQLNRNLYEGIVFREFKSRSQFGFKFQDRRVERNIDKRATINFVAHIKIIGNQLPRKIHIVLKAKRSLTDKGSLNRNFVRTFKGEIIIHIEHQMAGVILIGHNRLCTIPMAIFAKGCQGIHKDDLDIGVVVQNQIMQENSRQATMVLHTDIQMSFSTHLNLIHINVVNFTRSAIRDINVCNFTIT